MKTEGAFGFNGVSGDFSWDVLENQDHTVIPALAPRQEQGKHMTLNLGSIRYNVSPTKAVKKSGWNFDV